MTEPVTIEYTLYDGTGVRIKLHQVGNAQEWVLDLFMERADQSHPVHQHAIVGEPEVSVG